MQRFVRADYGYSLPALACLNGVRFVWWRLQDAIIAPKDLSRHNFKEGFNGRMLRPYCNNKVWSIGNAGNSSNGVGTPLQR